MPTKVKLTKLTDGTKEALALNKINYDSETKKLTLYSSEDNNFKEETTISVETDTTLSERGAPADAWATGSAIASVQAQIGSPLVANQASKMTDTSKIYVYTGTESGYTKGNWYYYNGTAWVSGGAYNANAYETDKTLTIANRPADAQATGSAIEDLNLHISEVESEISDYIDAKSVNGLLYENSILYLTSNNEIVGDGVEIKGGGGGGGGDESASVIEVTNTTGWLSKTISYGQNVELTFTWSSTEDDQPTGNGTLQVYVNNSLKRTANIAQGQLTVDVSKYLVVGSNSIRIRISDIYGKSRNIIFTVRAVELTLTSNFDTSVTFDANVSFDYTYTPNGALEKTIHFILDSVEIGTSVVTTSGRQQTYTLPSMAHGSHTLLVYFVAEVDGEEVTSNELYYDLTVVNAQSKVPIITSDFRKTTVAQYETLAIPYKVYTPNSLQSNVVLLANGEQVSAVTVDRTTQTWSYRFDNIGTTTLTIQTGNVTKEFELTVTESEIDVEAETDALSLYLTSYGRSNNEENPNTWVDADRKITTTMTGFNFTSNGWVNDKDGITVLRINNGAKVTIPVKPFMNDFRSGGKTIEVEFAARDVYDYNAVPINCMSDGRGFQLTAQRATLKSEQTEITTQYKEDEHVRISFVVEKRTENRLMLIYINGIASGVIQYPDNDDFSQQNPVNIVLGADDITLDIYNIRIYDNNLTRYQILDNWIADTQLITEKIRRYEHNNIYDEYGQVVIDKLPNDLPYFILDAVELPQYKGDKKTISGSYIDPQHSSKSFTFTGCQINVQGTSSAPYPRKNYDMQFKKGFEIQGEHADNYELADGIIPFNRFVLKADVASSEGANNVELVKLYCDLNPFETREKKADPKVRSGIYGFPIVLFWHDLNTGKIQFMGKYNFNLPKRAPAPYGYSGDMESWEFQNNTSNLMLFKSDFFDESIYTDPTTGDTKERWRFDYEARFPSDEWINYAKLQELQSFIYSTYRAGATGNALANPVTYPSTKTEIVEVVDPETGAISYEEKTYKVDVTYTTDTADYRLAKFRAEFGNYAEVDSFIFYYIFTELFLMVDSRAKNLFIGFSGSDTTGLKAIDRKAVAEPYDMDTAIGTNNEGALVFGYSYEDTDHLEGGAEIFNGQTSVLWCNIRDAFPSEITTMYQRLRSGGLNYANVEKRFEDHQGKWSEAIFNEDSWFKYIYPLIKPDTGKDPTGSYLSMMQGSKAEQRKWWLYNRFRYMDSKWNAGDALTDVIQVRGYAKADITVTPYADIYPTVKYGSYTVSQRGTHGVPVTLACPVDNLNDTEIYIYSAPQLSSVGDLSPLKVGFADFSKATSLQSIVVGSGASGYTNLNLKELRIGINNFLKLVDARNCSALTGSVDLSGARNIEEVYFDGTNISAVDLPVGGVLKTISLPSTITNLTIRNQNEITNFSVTNNDYSNISTLRVENSSSAIPILDILSSVDRGSRVRIIGFTMAVSTQKNVEDFYAYLDTMRGLGDNGETINNPVVSGTITGLDTITGTWLAQMNARYPDIKIEYQHISSILKYYTYDGGTLLYTETVRDGGDGTYDGKPTRAADARYTYTFAGWTTTPNTSVEPNALKNVTADRDVYAAYDAEGQKYTVYFYNNNGSGGQGTLLQTVNNVLYEGTAVYTGATPKYPSDPDNFEFSGWSPSNERITGNTSCIAQYKDLRSPVIKYVEGTLDEYVSETNTDKIAPYALSNLATLKKIKAPVTRVCEYGVYNSKVETVELTNTAPVTIEQYAFQSNPLQNLIIRSETVSTLNSTNALEKTPIIAGLGCIYVPSAILSSYKSASNWSTFADNIYPIDSYPVTNFETISDSWSQIIASIDNGSYSTKYAVGDTKKININNVDVYAQIVAFDRDVLEDGTTTVPITFIVKQFGWMARMNSNRVTEGGWADCKLRKDLNDEENSGVILSIDSSVASRIKAVKKTYTATSNSSSTASVVDKLWVPSAREIFGGSSYENDGITYTDFFNTTAKKIKYNINTLSASNWWLRSVSTSISFRNVYTSGSVDQSYASNNGGVALGFCLG